MTAKEVLHNIEKQREEAGIAFLGHIYLEVPEYRKVTEALEKQIPKKPYMDNENGIYETEHCPTCHRRLFPNDHHCRCGQALDWSDE